MSANNHWSQTGYAVMVGPFNAIIFVPFIFFVLKPSWTSGLALVAVATWLFVMEKVFGMRIEYTLDLIRHSISGRVKNTLSSIRNLEF